jgi:hypothetical protein
MDEIDAALDFKNVSIVANYIKERTRNAQFIIISLRLDNEFLAKCSLLIFVILFRSNMFELADRLVGIYKTYNCTKSVTINPHLIELAPPHPQPNLTQTPAKAGLSKPAVVPLGENNSNASNTVQAMEVA